MWHREGCLRVVIGGEVKRVRLEQVWIDAYVDYVPYRGTQHREGDTWVPLDASYKEYEYGEPMDIVKELGFDVEGFLREVSATAEVDLIKLI